MRLGSARKRSSVAPALVMPYPVLENAGLRLRRGQTSLTVAAPGVGKSQLWQNFAQRMRVPTLYWSGDTDQSDVTIRTLAMHTGVTVDEVEEWLLDETCRQWLFEKLADRSDHIEWWFDSPITGPVLGERMNAFAAKFGEYPHLVVVDNMSNAVSGGEGEQFLQIQEIQTAMQKLSRETKAHIAVLHHAKGEYDSGNRAIPQSGGMFNPFKIPEVGLTMYRPDGDHRLAINIVKMRGGKSDPAAAHPHSLSIDFSRASVLGHTHQQEGGADG